MRTAFLIILAIGIVLGPGLSGCTFHIADGYDTSSSHESVVHNERKARKYVANAQIGTPVSSVIATLGTPDFTDLLPTSDGDLRVLRYRTHRAHADGETTRDETTPLVFKDERLVGTGELALRAATAGMPLAYNWRQRHIKKPAQPQSCAGFFNLASPSDKAKREGQVRELVQLAHRKHVHGIKLVDGQARGLRRANGREVGNLVAHACGAEAV